MTSTTAPINSDPAAIVRRLKEVTALSSSGLIHPTPMLATIEAIAIGCLDRPDAPQISITGDDALTLELDRTALAMLLGELIANAAVHGRRPDGPCKLALHLRQGDDGAIWLDVRDSGPGMDDATAACYFRPFITTRRAEGHMGLGGYIVRSLARDALQGAALLLREPGVAGTCVRVVFARPSAWLALGSGG